MSLLKYWNGSAWTLVPDGTMVKYWNGSAWLDVPGGAVSNNSLVWRQFLVGSITTSKIRVYVSNALNGYSRITEVEAWGVPAGGGRTNVALASNGATPAPSSTIMNIFPGSGVIDGDRRGTNWSNGGGWNDATPGVFPDFFEIVFNGAKNVDEINVFTVQDNWGSPSEPTPSMTFTLYGIRDFQVQYWTGNAWQTVPGGSIVGNNLVWRQFVFTPVNTTRIRVYVTNALGDYTRLTEIEAWGSN